MKKWAKWTIGVSCGVAVTTAIAVPVGLYLSGYWDTYKQITYKVGSGLIDNASMYARSGESNANVSVFDPRFNKDAQNKLQDLSKDLSKKDLQRDFDRVLTDFYEAYEDESSGNSEVEIEDIKVKSKNDDGSFNLTVEYEIEDDKNDIEETKYHDIKWTPKFTVLSKADIESIKAQITGFGKHESNGVDLKDIKEIFLGDDDKDDEDDDGIFDRVAKLNKEYNGFAGMVAYDLSISDIFDQLPKPKTRAASEVTKDTHFRIPSLSLNNGQSAVALTPDKQPNVNIDLSKGHILGITKQELTSLPAGTYTDKAKINEYLSFVFGTANQPSDIKDVTIAEPDVNGYLKLSIHFNNSSTPTEIFYLYVSDPAPAAK